MAKDFRTKQIRTTKLIGSGGIDQSKPYLGLLIYSSSDAANYNGGTQGNLSTNWPNIGNDVWMAVGGTRNANGITRADGSSVLFIGDVVVSGTLWAERSIIEVDESVVGEFIAPNVAAMGLNKDTSENNVADGWARALVDPTTINDWTAPAHDPGATPPRRGTVSFNMVRGINGEYKYINEFPATYKDVFFHVSGSRGVRGTNDRGIALFEGDLHTSGNFSMSPHSVWTTDIILDNSTDDPPIIAQQNGFGKRWTEIAVQHKGANKFDVEIANSGSDPNSGIKFKVRAGDPDESALVFSGSGDLALDPAVPDGSPGGDGRGIIFNTDQDLSLQSVDWAGTHTSTEAWGKTFRLKRGGSNLEYKSFQISGLTLTASSGMLMGAPGNGANGFWGQALGLMFAGTTVSTPQQGPLGGGPGTAGLYYNNAAPFTNPHLGGPEHAFIMTASGGTQKLHIGAENVYVKGMAGVSIEASDPARDDPHGGPIHLYATGSGITMHGSVVINDNLTVHGDSIIGHVKTMTVEDPLILLNSGALSSNTGGGIAIASGSSFPNQSLVFGRSNSYNNTFIAGRLDVEDGHVASLGGTITTDIQAAGYRFGPWPQHIITASADMMVFSASRFAFEAGRSLFFNDMGGTVSMDDGAVFLKYNNGQHPGPQDLHIGIGSGSLVVAADSMEPTFLYLGGNTPGYTWFAQGASTNGGGTQLFTDQSLIISSSGGMYLSASQEIIISASYNPNNDGGYPAHRPVKIFGGKLILSSTNPLMGVDQGVKISGPENSIFGTMPNSSIWLDTAGSQNDPGDSPPPGWTPAGSPTGILISGSGHAMQAGIVYVNVRADELGLAWGGSDGNFQGGGPARPNENTVYGSWSGPGRFTDVNFMVSGSMNSMNSTTRGTALFMGDLKVSGAADFGALALDNLLLQGTAPGEPWVKFGADELVSINRTVSDQLQFTDTIAGGPYTLTDLATCPVVDNATVFTVVDSNIGNKYLSRIKTSGSISFDHNYNDSNPAPTRLRYSSDVGADIFFFVSGSKGGKVYPSVSPSLMSGPPSVAVFEGDLLTSGALYFEELDASIASSISVGPDSVSIYAKDVSGETRLFYRNDVMESPIGAGGSLDDAYNQPDGGGAPVAGAGAIIEVDDQPVQLQAEPSGGTEGQIVLALTGSLEVHGTADDITMAVGPNISFPGAYGGQVQATSSGADLMFGNNSTARLQTTVLKILGTSGNVQIQPTIKLSFASDTYTYLKQTMSTSALQIHNVQDGGEIQLYAGLSTGDGSYTTDGTVHIRGNVLPTEDDEFDLGSVTNRWANVYTGDLHLRNERGDWTIVEERDYLCVVNNITGKKYKMALEPIEDDE